MYTEFEDSGAGELAASLILQIGFEHKRCVPK